MKQPDNSHPVVPTFVETTLNQGRECWVCGAETGTVSINSSIPARFYCANHIIHAPDDVTKVKWENDVYGDDSEDEDVG